MIATMDLMDIWDTTIPHTSKPARQSTIICPKTSGVNNKEHWYTPPPVKMGRLTVPSIQYEKINTFVN